MTQTNFDLIGAAKDSLEGKWGIAIGGFIIFILVSAGASFIPGVGLVISGPLSLGLAVFSLTIARGYEPSIDQIFSGFNRFGKALGLYVLTLVLIVVGLIFFIVPGIILAIGFSQIYYIMADSEDIGIEATLRKSWDMMDGYKMKYFGLMMIFVALTLLSALTLFLGLIFLLPLFQVSSAKFYEDIRGELTVEDTIEKNLIG